MNANINSFLEDAVKDVNKFENRSGQLIISPHWYSLVFLFTILGSFVAIYFLRHSVSPYMFIGLFPIYILALIFTFEAKQEYSYYSKDFLKHKINTRHLSKIYQSLDKEGKAKFREIILTKKQTITYEDIKYL